MKSIFSFIIQIFMISLLISCEQEINQTENLFISYEEMYKDSVLLSIEGDLTDPTILWNNMSIYSFACERMHRHLFIDTIFNQLKWDFNNSSDLKISENIYNYITNCWVDDNKTLKENNNHLKKDGIYYTINYGNNKVQTKTPQYLGSNLNWNMHLCCQLITSQVKGPLKNFFDITNARHLLKPDSYGGYRIYQESQGSCGKYHYYIFIAHNFDQDPIINDITTYKTSGSYSSGIYEMACNRQHAPIVTVFNRRAFTCSTGL